MEIKVTNNQWSKSTNELKSMFFFVYLFCLLSKTAVNIDAWVPELLPVTPPVKLKILGVICPALMSTVTNIIIHVLYVQSYSAESLSFSLSTEDFLLLVF